VVPIDFFRRELAPSHMRFVEAARNATKTAITTGLAAIWPSPPEPRLLASIAADLERTRDRLELVGQRYLDPPVGPLPSPQVA
jgi:hypothetical protein